MSENEFTGPSRRVADDLRHILEVADGRAMPVSEILQHTQGRGLQTIAMVLCLPFLTPVAIPGLSIPFGIAIGICGLRIAFRHQPWLPNFISNRQISFAVLEKMLRFGILIHTKLEKFLRPRWTALTDNHAAQMGIGLTIAFAAFLLSLPIPPPFPLTNTIPGFAIILLCLGMIERDGMVIFSGYFLTVVASVYVGFIVVLGGAGAEQLWHWAEKLF